MADRIGNRRAVLAGVALTLAAAAATLPAVVYYGPTPANGVGVDQTPVPEGLGAALDKAVLPAGHQY